MSFLYPRTVTVRRVADNDTPGEQEYGGKQTSTADLIAGAAVIAAGLKAHIEAERQGTSPAEKLPADAAGQSIWIIILPKAALGLVRNRDFITDDQGLNYQVISADWGPLVTSCRSQILET